MTTASLENGRGFVAEVESIRGLAAFLVAFGHAAAMTLVVQRADFTPGGIAHFLVSAQIHASAAVLIFFVISGYVLGLSLDRDAQAEFPAEYLAFVWRRCWRIYPAHLVSLCLLVPIGLALLTWRHTDLSPFAFLTPIERFHLHGDAYRVLTPRALFNGAALLATRYNNVTWSLRVEVLMGLVLPFMWRLSRLRRAGVDIAVLAVSCGIFAVWNPEPDRWLEYALSFFPAFYLGLVIPTLGRSFAELVVRHARGGLAPLAVCYLAIVVTGGYWDSPLAQFAACLGAFGFISLIVFGTPGIANAALRSPPLRWFGRISYSFYLWHFYVMVWLVAFAMRLLPASFVYAHDVVFFLAILSLSVAAAAVVAQISYRFVELPAIRAGRKIGARIGLCDARRAVVSGAGAS